MSKLPAPTAKDINEAHRLARSSAETAVQHAIRCGQMLIQVGADQAWVERHTDVAWSTAKRYVTAAKQNAQGIAFESLRHCFPSGQKTRAAAEKRGETATAVAKNSAPAAEIDAFSDPETPAPSVKGAALNPPASRPQPETAAVLADDWAPEIPDEEELAAIEREVQESEARVLRADDVTAGYHAELKRQAAEIAVLKVTRDGYMRGKEAVTKMLQAEQRKVARLEKELAKLRASMEAA